MQDTYFGVERYSTVEEGVCEIRAKTIVQQQGIGGHFPTEN